MKEFKPKEIKWITQTWMWEISAHVGHRACHSASEQVSVTMGSGDQGTEPDAGRALWWPLGGCNR